MKDDIKVSVVIPVYNVELYLRDCLDSIINQTYSNTEIICVNDGSTDGSLAILEEYRSQDDRVFIINQENSGSSVTRNAGMQQASGKYILFVDSDDMLKANAIESLLKYSEENKLDVLYYEAETIFQTDDIREKFWKYNTYYRREKVIPEVLTGEELFSKLIANKEYRVQPCLQFTTREHICNNHIDFPVGIVHQDNVFTFKNIIQAKRAAVINEIYYIRRVRENSIMTQRQGFKSLYGFLVCYIEIVHFALDKKFSSSTEQAIREVLSGLIGQICATYKNFDSSDKQKLKELSPLEEMWFEIAIRSREELSTFTFVPRKIRAGIRCLKEHGVGYTIKRLLCHLGIKG